jgi:hypothetical protein
MKREQQRQMHETDCTAAEEGERGKKRTNLSNNRRRHGELHVVVAGATVTTSGSRSAWSRTCLRQLLKEVGVEVRHVANQDLSLEGARRR